MNRKRQRKMEQQATKKAAFDRPAVPKKKKTVKEHVVENYMFALERAYRAATQTESSDAQRETSTQIWSMLSNAKIFEFSPALYALLHHEVDKFITEQLCGFKWSPPGGPEPPETESQRLLDVTQKARRNVSFPETLPFEVCFFGYGEGVSIPSASASSMTLEFTNSVETAERVRNFTVNMIYGHLVSSKGNVFTLLKSFDGGNTGGYMWAVEERVPGLDGAFGGWHTATTLTPWIVTALLNYINEHTTVILEQPRTFTDTWNFDKLRHKLKVPKTIPPPYYTVHLKEQLIRDTGRRLASAIKKEIDWKHRWTVRGHYVYRIRRGILPLDPKLEAKLLKKRYKVFTTNDLDQETYRILLRKNLPIKQPNEWLAILIFFRHDYVKGPEDKPLIPSERKTSEDFSLEGTL